MKRKRRWIGAWIVGAAVLPGWWSGSLAGAGWGEPSAFAGAAQDRPDYNLSTVTVSAATVQGDGNVALRLVARNKFGDAMAGGGLLVKFYASGGSSRGVISVTTDHKDGSYTANFHATTTGTPTSIVATINGYQINSAAPSIEVLPRTQVVTSGTTSGTSGTAGTTTGTGTAGTATTGGTSTTGTTATTGTAGTSTTGTTAGTSTSGTTGTTSGTKGTTGGTSGTGTTAGTGTTTGTGTTLGTGTTVGTGTTIGTTTSGTTTGGTTTGGTTIGGTTTGGTTTGGTITGGTTAGGTTTVGGTTTGGTTTGGATGTDPTTEVQITPGAGFAGPTAEPGPVAGPASVGASAQAIARWDVVPHQDFTGDMRVGVLAFHVNEIDRVEFAANGGPWAAVRTMTVNPQTNVREFWATLRASDFGGGGAVEVRAIAYPKVGKPRLLDSLWLNVNPGGVLPSPVVYASPTGNDTTADGSQTRPFLSLSRAAKALATRGGGKADGGTIYLLPGAYELSSEAGVVATVNRWLTIAAAPGVAKSQAVLTGSAGSSGLCVRLLRLSNLTIHPKTWTEVVNGVQTTKVAGQVVRANGSVTDSKLWLDGVDCIGPGRLVASAANMSWVTAAASGGFKERYFTNCYTRDAADGLTQATLNRGSTSEYITADHWQNSLAVVNCIARHTDKSGTGAHPDVIQYTGASFENMILYGNTATEDAISQGFFICGTVQKDIAIVGNKAVIPTNYWLFKTSSANHMLVRGNNFTGGLSATAGPKWDAGPFNDVVVDEVQSQFPQATQLPSSTPTGVTYRAFTAAFD